MLKSAASRRLIIAGVFLFAACVMSSAQSVSVKDTLMRTYPYGDPDPVQPVKEEIDLDTFAKLDFRVCKVLKAQEIRKSHSCLKLTLDDGLGERTIVSSIKEEYKPEDLVGRKIIVVANLKPTRITGVTSQGMLLAGTNNACGCKVIFVDDSIPCGTAVK